LPPPRSASPTPSPGPGPTNATPAAPLGLIADRDRRIRVGAWAVAPLASEWIHQAALAIRAKIPVDTLLDQVAQYPTYTEAYLAALEQLRMPHPT
jgi:dihydrolipoamide dehydrogenase